MKILHKIAPQLDSKQFIQIALHFDDLLCNWLWLKKLFNY